MAGRRSPGLLVPVKRQEASPNTVRQDIGPDYAYKVGRRAIKMGEYTLQPGEPVLGAELWPRIESWVRTGALVPR